METAGALALVAAVALVQGQAKFEAPGFNRLVWVDTPHFNRRDLATPIDTIVLHHTASGNLAGTVSWFQNKESRVSSHYIVGKDGSVVQVVSRFDRAWHAGKSQDSYGRKEANAYSIGIELVNKGDGKDPWTEPQLGALHNLLTLLVRWHPVKQITSHEFVAEPQGRKNDPRAFPWDRFRDFGVPLFFGMKPDQVKQAPG